ncbi:MAG: hypothetical protein Q7R34_05045 [Dehalococcoidia bacterium]|nr:hypothetical protein [Dehalococcoidia bacterium]
MSTVISGIFEMKDIIETIPIQVMMVAVPAAIAALATVAAIVARLVENWVSHGSH